MKNIALPIALLCATSSLTQAADFMAGRDAYIRGDFQVAYNEFLPLAKEGDPKSRVGMGLLYAKGQGVAQSDVEAHRWFTLVATQKPKPNVFVHTVAVENRKVLVKRMTQNQIATAQTLANKTQLAQLDSAVIENSEATSPEALEQIAAAAGSPPPPPPLFVRPPTAPPPALPEPPRILNSKPVSAKPISIVPKAPVAQMPEPTMRAPLPTPVERQVLQAPVYQSKTILPSSRNGPTTTIGVIPPNRPAPVISRPSVQQPPVRQPNVARKTAKPLMQAAALTPEWRNSGQRAILIQLGAYRDSPRSVAERAWKRIIRKHSDVVGTMNPVIVEADLGAKGIYQRLRTGPFASTAEAQNMCNTLRSRQQRCYVIRGQL